MRITHIGTATVLVELGGVRVLTDPIFDAAGRHYDFGFGMHSTKRAGPALDAAAIGRVDAVLLTHDQHGDNLDDAGRALLASVPLIATTRAAAARLRKEHGDRVVGLAPWQSVRVSGGATAALDVTATPARHGPPLSLPFVGPVIGFSIAHAAQKRGEVWITGDTVKFSGTDDVVRSKRIGTALLHLGAAGYGPLRFTMNGKEGARLAKALPEASIVPVHYDGWTHFHEDRAAAERAFAAAGVADRVTWLAPGVATEIAD